MKTSLAILTICLMCGCESFRTVEQQIFDNAAAAVAATNDIPEQPHE